jgi:hypothetical protein
VLQIAANGAAARKNKPISEESGFIGSASCMTMLSETFICSRLPDTRTTDFSRLESRSVLSVNLVPRQKKIGHDKTADSAVDINC